MSDLKSIAASVQEAASVGDDAIEKALKEIDLESMKAHPTDDMYAEGETYQVSSKEEVIEEVEEDTVEPVEDDDEDCVISGLGTIDDGIVTIDEITSIAESFKLDDEALKEGLSELDGDTFTTVSAEIKEQIQTYRKSLIIKSGFSEDEATEAAHRRLQKLMGDATEEYLEKNPKVGVIEIRKENVEELGLTKEEHDKLAKVKVVKLRVVEDADLKEMKVKKLDKKHKTQVLQTLDSPLSKYDVPLPLTADYMTFRGAQILQLMTAIGTEDDGPLEITSKQANLLYDRLWTGAQYQKYGPKRETILSFEKFTNIFRYHDIELGMYAILVASSMNDIETTLTCGQCEGEFKHKYNLKSLLNLEDLSETFKEKFNNILKNKTNKEGLATIREENDKKYRVQSPYTSNCYEISYPSIARALAMFSRVDTTDPNMVYLMAIGLFIHAVYVLDPDDGEYIEILENEYVELFNVLQAIPQEDLDLLTEYVKDKFYQPKFILKSRCPHCSNDMTNEFKISDLVFLKAQDSQTETEL